MSEKPKDHQRSALPVPSGPVIEHTSGPGGKTRHTRSGRSADPVFEAQVLGGGEKRGIKGGTETLDRAKSTYLKSEYSGPNDRRPQPGRVTKTEI